MSWNVKQRLPFALLLLLIVIKQWLSIKTDTVDVAILHFVNLLFDFLSIVVYTCQESNPCQNGGTCFEVKEGDVKTLTSHDESTPLPDDKTDKYLKFQCVCPYGYRGSLCQYRKLIISYQCMK